MEKLFVYGTPVRGETIAIPKSSLANLSSVVGAMYEIDMDVKVVDPKKLNRKNFEEFKKRLYEKHHAKVKYFEVVEHKGEQRAVLQLSGSPFTFAALIATIVELAPLIGLAVIGVVVYYITKKHPGVMSLLVWGGIIFLVFGGLSKLMVPGGKEETVGE